MNSSIKKIVIVACATILTCAASVVSSPAQIIGFNENGVPTSTPGNTGLQGFEFSVNQNVDLTALGFYAQSIGGGDTPHVSLFDFTSGITATPTPLYDTGDLNHPTNQLPVSPGWNYITLATPILLTTGHTYAVTAPAYFVEQYSSLTGFTYGSAINSPTFLNDTSTSFFGGGSWSNAGYNFTQLIPVTSNVNISANLEYTLPPPAPTPEPSTWLLLGVGLTVLTVGLRRRAASATLERQAALETLRQRIESAAV